MTVNAGGVAYASDVNGIQPKAYEATCSVATTFGTSAADVTGASITFTTATASATAVCIWTADNSITVASAGVIAIVFLSVDGVDDNSRQLLKDLRTLDRITHSQRYLVTLGAAGSHTIKLRCQKTGAGGTAQLQTGHTGLTITVHENV